MGNLPWVLAGLVAGGILHILTVLGMPWLSGNDAWARLSAKLPVNSLTIAGGKGPAVLPFASPDVIHAYCVFDLSERNVVVTSPLADPAWSVAVSTRSGENFYVITGADLKKPSVRILIIPRDRLASEGSTEKTEEGTEQNIIVSPTSKGVVAIRAPLRGESFRARTESLLREAHCRLQEKTEPMPEPAASAEPAPDEEFVPRHGRRHRRHWR